MDVRGVFDVFSRRRNREPAVKPRKPLTEAFRNRVLMLCRDRFMAAGGGEYLITLWRETHRRFTYLLGRTRLSKTEHHGDAELDVLEFLMDCVDDHFLDFIEYIFRASYYFHVCEDENDMVQEINHFLLLEDLPYAVTRFIREMRTEEMFGRPMEVGAVVAFPQVVLRENQFLHAEAVAPAIELLSDRGFSSANQEFLAALEDYRKGRYGDCLTKCGSAFESTMKLICARREWAYQETDGAADLVRAIRANSGMEGYFEQPLMLIATLRNRLSTSHGAGQQARIVPPHKARYVINATAAAILLLVEECA